MEEDKGRKNVPKYDNREVERITDYGRGINIAKSSGTNPRCTQNQK